MTRQETSAARRKAFHLPRIEAVTTDIGRLWKAFAWLAAEARRARRLNETTNAVLELVSRVQQGHPLPDAPHGFTPHSAPHLRHTPWHARDDADHDPTERVA